MADAYDVLREEIARLDQELLDLIERRFRLSAEVGRRKAEQGRAVTVQEVERRVLDRARAAAGRCGVFPESMAAIFRAVLDGSVECQHRVGVELRRRGGRRLLVVGDAGGMGGWLHGFLGGIGHEVEGVDPAWAGRPPAAGGRHATLDQVADLERYAAVIVSVPLDAGPQVLHELAGRGACPPVIEIASIKSHLQAGICALTGAGVQVLSLHPMFGPGKNVYEPLTMVHAVVADEEGERARILELLGHPYLDLVSVPMEHHDRLMGWLLGLGHLVAMLFAGALSRSGHDPRELERVASTTYARQVATARSVLGEDPALYYAIQRLNPHRGEVYAAIAAALSDWTGVVERGDAPAFSGLMHRGAEALRPGDLTRI